MTWAGHGKSCDASRIGVKIEQAGRRRRASRSASCRRSFSPRPTAAIASLPGRRRSPIPFYPPRPSSSAKPATPHPSRRPATPQNPFMAAERTLRDPRRRVADRRLPWGGPLGRSPRTLSQSVGRDCGSITFDRRGRVVSVCVGVTGPELYMFDPNTLAELATFSLPPRQDVPTNVFQDFTGGGYFYLDSHDRVVTSTTTRHIYVIAETAGSRASSSSTTTTSARCSAPARRSPRPCPTSTGCCGS